VNGSRLLPTSALLLAGILAGLLAVLPRPVRAEVQTPGITVVLVGQPATCPDRAWTEAEDRLIRELEALAVQVTAVEARHCDEARQGRELKRIARRGHADAAVQLRRSSSLSGIELWFTEAKPLRVTMRFLPLHGAVDDSGAEVVALKAVEAVLGPHYTLHLAQYGSPPPPPPAEPRVAFLFDAGPSLLASPGGAPPRTGLRLTAAWPLARRTSLRLSGLLSPAGAPIETAYASSSLEVGLVRAWLGYDLVGRGPLQVTVMAGGGVALLSAQGISTSHGVARDATVTGDVGVGAELRGRLHRNLWVRLGCDLDLLLPGATIRFAGEPVATYGQPLTTVSAGLVLALP